MVFAAIGMCSYGHSHEAYFKPFISCTASMKSSLIPPTGNNCLLLWTWVLTCATHKTVIAGLYYLFSYLYFRLISSIKLISVSWQQLDIFTSLRVLSSGSPKVLSKNVFQAQVTVCIPCSVETKMAT